MDERERAQDLALAAMEVWGTEQSLARIQQALALDPSNVDALVLMARLAPTIESQRQILDAAILSAEERLGPKFEKAYRGRFWHDLDTRPYMRALVALAEHYEAAGQRKEAIATLDRVLRLNPNDNQGVRYVFLGLVLAERMLIKTRKLFEAYPNDDSAWFMWGQVLYYFVMKDRPKATRLLKKARQLNPYVELYLGGNKPIPSVLPDTYSIGAESEAILAVCDLVEAWSRRQYALYWLNSKLSGDPDLIRYVARVIDGR